MNINQTVSSVDVLNMTETFCVHETEYDSMFALSSFTKHEKMYIKWNILTEIFVKMFVFGPPCHVFVQKVYTDCYLKKIK